MREFKDIQIAAPTNYDSIKNYFDTSHVDEVIDLVISLNPDAVWSSRVPFLWATQAHHPSTSTCFSLQSFFARVKRIQRRKAKGLKDA